MTFDLSQRSATVVYDTSLADIREINRAIDRANELMRSDDDLTTGDADRVLG